MPLTTAPVSAPATAPAAVTAISARLSWRVAASSTALRTRLRSSDLTWSASLRASRAKSASNLLVLHEHPLVLRRDLDLEANGMAEFDRSPRRSAQDFVVLRRRRKERPVLAPLLLQNG